MRDVDRLRCVYCGEIVGVYEPIRLSLADGSDRRGSALSLSDLLAAPGRAVVHEHCHAAYERGRATRPADADR